MNKSGTARAGESRPHAFTILYNLKRFTFALVIPLSRGLLSALSDGGLSSWAGGAWIDITTLAAILSMSALMWRVCSYTFDSGGLHVWSGVFIRSHLYIPGGRAATLTAVRSFYLKPFGAVRVRADTLAGPRKSADLSLFVSRAEAARILAQRKGALENGGLTRQYRPRSLYIAALAAFSSSSFAGILFLATLISRAGELLGNEFRDRVYGTFERVTSLLAFGVPPAAAAIAYLLLFGWLVAFTVNFIRHKNLCIRRQDGALTIEGGVFTNRSYLVDVDAINYVDIRQSVLSWVLRFCSVHINAVGYSKYKDDVSGVVPAVKTRDVGKTLNMFFPEFRPVPRQVWHNWGALFKFIGDASWGCVLIPGATFLLRHLIPGWAAFTGWMGLMLSVPAYWFLIVRLIDYFSSGLAREGDRFTLRYSSGYFLHTIVMPRSKIASVCLRQSPIQYFDKKCDVLVFSFAERSARHHIRNVDQEAARALFGLEEEDPAPGR